MPLGGASSQLVHPRLHAALQGSAVGDRGMPDLGIITRPASGTGTTDPNTGDWVPAAPTTVYDDAETAGAGAPLRVQAMPTDDTTTVVGDDVVTLHRYRVGVPASAAQVLVDDVVTVTASADTPLVGRHLVVRAVNYDTFLARRLLLCEDHPDEPTEAP